MKILIVAQNFWPENFRINDLALGMIERGHDVSVLTGLPNYPKGEFFPGYNYSGPYYEEWESIKILRVPLISRGKSKGVRLFLNYVSFAFFGCLLAPWRLRNDRFDKIFVYQPSPVSLGLPAVLLHLLYKTPIYFWVTDLWPETLVATGVVKSKFLLGMVEKLVKFIYKRCCVILVSCKGFKPKIQKLGFESKPIIYWPQWAEKVSRDDSIAIEPLPEGFKIVFTGNIGASQAFDVLLSAAEKVMEINQAIKWIFIGDGRMLEWVRQEIKSRKLETTVYLIGSKPLNYMSAYYEQADALLVSLKDEPLFSITVPSKIQSYLTSGKPIIASLNGEGAELIESAEAGLVAPAGDPDELAKCVLKLYTTPKSKLKQMGENGNNYFEQNFEREKQFSKLEQIMDTY